MFFPYHLHLIWLFFLKTAEHFSGASNSRKLGFYREPAESASTSKDVCHLHFITNLLKWLYDFEPTDSTLWKFAWVILKPWPNTGVLRTLLKAGIPGSHLKSTDLETLRNGLRKSIAFLSLTWDT